MSKKKTSFTAFVSYKWESPTVKKWVETFARDLRLLGIDVLLDQWEVGFGDSFLDYMSTGLQKANVVLFIVTPAAVASVEAAQEKGGALKFEARLAQARQIAGSSLKIVPILLRGEHIPFSMEGTRWADFRSKNSYHENIIALANDLLGHRGKPPLGGTGRLKYDGAVLCMYAAVKGGPLRPMIAQSEPFVGFPFFSAESDNPTGWPPRVYQDRQEFTKRIAALFADNSTFRSVDKLNSRENAIQIQILKSRPSSTDEEGEERLIQAYQQLRSYFSYEIARDEKQLRAILKKSVADQFLALERERAYITDQMPNRILIARCLVDGPLALTEASVTIQVHGDVYDVSFDDQRLLPIEEIKALLFQRKQIRLPDIHPGQIHELKIWYNYTDLAARKDPQPVDIAAEPSQGLRVLRFEALGAPSEPDRSLCENVVAYHRYTVDIPRLAQA